MRLGEAGPRATICQAHHSPRLPGAIAGFLLQLATVSPLICHLTVLSVANRHRANQERKSGWRLKEASFLLGADLPAFWVQRAGVLA